MTSLSLITMLSDYSDANDADIVQFIYAVECPDEEDTRQ